MRSVFAILISVAALAAAAPQGKPTRPSAPASSAAPAADRRAIPPGAVEREPGRFYYTDKDGKKWIYARTPFGIARTEDKGTAEPKKAGDPLANIKVTESGDTVTFERPGPFGTFRWQKKMADLDPQERAALNRSRATATGPAVKDADSAGKQER